MGYGHLLVTAEPSVVGQLHTTATTPAPHWVVLLAVVPLLWVVIGGAVFIADRLLERYGI
ncbi:hypothetical protein G9464_17605 [Halostella sp. JP-L12]|uniref:hypothetical protein n=1 Tax=Halostella TaxID=1843185 RepID=UPI000EF7958F|nr:MULTISPECIES: hypothetical protein [Halostella]NHN49390.1 hypothetical protein [Halostella sp. JP-L12]